MSKMQTKSNRPIGQGLIFLVFSLDHVKSDENYDAAINDETDVGVDDQADIGVDDQADAGVDDQADEGVEDLVDDTGVNDNDAAIADEDNNITASSLHLHFHGNDTVADDDTAVADNAGHIVEANVGHIPDKGITVDKSGPCTLGTYFKVECNICFCYESNVQGCTNTDCSKQSKKTLLSNPATRLKFKKLRDSATGCVPGEKIKQGICECSCAIPSVLTCPKECL